MGPGVKLDLWKLGEEVLAGLLEVDSFPAGLNVERIAEAHTGAPLHEPAGGKAPAQESLELGGVALAHRFGPADLLAQLGRELIRRRRGGDSRTIVRRGSSIVARRGQAIPDRKSTRLNSSHSQISYAVFCLKKKKQQTKQQRDHLRQEC